MTDENHDFQLRLSTTTCNATFCKYIYNAFKYGFKVKVIYTDFAKTFDSVKYEVLIFMLEDLTTYCLSK